MLFRSRQERHGVDPAGPEDVASCVGWVEPDGEAGGPPARVLRPADAAADETGECPNNTRGRSEHESGSAANPGQVDRAAGEPKESYDPDAYYRTHLEAVRGTPWKPDTKIHYRNPRGGPRRPTETGFPIWIPSGESPLRQVLEAADAIQASAFYVAADQWSGDNVEIGRAHV